jgi:hypothetical protein
LQKSFLTNTKEEKKKRASENWRRLSSRQLQNIKSKLNDYGVIIYFKPASNHRGNIVVCKNGEHIQGVKEYKNFEAKLKLSDTKWNEVIEELYAQEFLKIKLEFLTENELIIRNTLLS